MLRAFGEGNSNRVKIGRFVVAKEDNDLVIIYMRQEEEREVRNAFFYSLQIEFDVRSIDTFNLKHNCISICTNC